MNRRAVITIFGGAAASSLSWPLAARAQQAPLPVIGYLSLREFEDLRLAAFRQGLREAGYVEGRNVQIEYRRAAGNDQLPEMAADLVRRRVAVIVAAGGTPAALAAKAATSTIPIVFGVAVDPVEVGLVASLNHPGGNVTGVTNLNAQVGPKRLELVHELLPGATVFALLVDPTGPALADPVVRDSQAAARTLGVTLHVLHASSDGDLEAALASVAQLRAAALIISPSTFFTARSERLAALTVRHAVPAIFQYRPFAAAGGLLSYGTNETEYYRPIGVYAGRILKGEKPGDLPVQRSSKVELIVNLKTAQALGLTVPLTLLGRADEVIE